MGVCYQGLHHPRRWQTAPTTGRPPPPPPTTSWGVLDGARMGVLVENRPHPTATTDTPMSKPRPFPPLCVSLASDAADLSPSYLFAPVHWLLANRVQAAPGPPSQLTRPLMLDGVAGSWPVFGVPSRSSLLVVLR